MIRTDHARKPLDDLATGVLWLDANLRVTYANPAFAEHTGCGQSRLAAHGLSILQPEGERLNELARRAQTEGQVFSLHGATVCAAPGQDARLDFTLTPHANGVLVEVHPTAPAASTQRVSESLRGFAHEVRNPLAAISGAAQLLQQRTADAEQGQLAQLIRSETARLAELAERLLGTRNSMTVRAINVHAPLERVIELLEAESTPVTIKRDYDPSLPAWQGDPDRLLQALLNLVRNAVEANARMIVLRSRAETGWRDTRGQRVPALRLEVDDDGDGVPAAIEATLFDPIVSGRAEGTGLGLALAREIAREHGGDLRYQRRAPGSRFVLLLPRHPPTRASDVDDA